MSVPIGGELLYIFRTLYFQVWHENLLDPRKVCWDNEENCCNVPLYLIAHILVSEVCNTWPACAVITTAKGCFKSF